MLQGFDEWSANLAETASMAQLQGAFVGIEATEYLARLKDCRFPDLSRSIKEALLPALGGLPYGLREVVQKTLAIWKKHNITPIFVFSGLDVGKRDSSFRDSERGVETIRQAWMCYESGQGEMSVETFNKSDLVTPEDQFRLLQSILREEGVTFQVAPYGAQAQLAYLQKSNAVDTVYASSEVLLYDVSENITYWDFESEQFVWVRRRACLQDLNVSQDVFVDACMLTGSSLLPPFSQVRGKQHFRVKSAVEMIMKVGNGSANNAILHYRDEHYLDMYRKARMAVRHHMVLTAEGKVEPFEYATIPGDLHEVVAQRLPEELYFYLSKGILGPRILNWRTSAEILEPPPLDSGVSPEYRKLVGEQLTEMRTTAIGLLSRSLHRFYLHKDLHLRCWFDKENTKVISMKNLDDPGIITSTWHVREDLFGPVSHKNKGSGCIGTCVKLLKDPEFAAKTITVRDTKNKDSVAPPMETKDEILLNSVWRMLHLRGYIDDKHNLTPWGVVLYEILADLPSGEHEEGALIAVELARFHLLNANDMFRSYSGAPNEGTEQEKRHQVLISRVACVGNFGHEQIGFSGPLNRSLLAYHSMVSAVQSSLRDLAEVCLTTLLLNGEAKRDRTDFAELGLDLPFLLQNNCALGLGVSGYFTSIVPANSASDVDKEKAYSDKNKDKALKTSIGLFAHAEDYPRDLKKAFRLWDAIYKGISASSLPSSQKTSFNAANTWLATVRPFDT